MSIPSFTSGSETRAVSRVDSLVHTLSLKSIIETFLEAISYVPLKADEVPSANSLAALTQVTGEEILSWNVDDGQDGRIFISMVEKAASSIEFCYPHHTLEAKAAFTLTAWFFFYVDDFTTIQSLEDCQRRLVLGLPQEDPVLVHLPAVLGRLYDHWDPVCANTMACSVLDLINGTILEKRREVCAMSVNPFALSWPKYLRSKSGIGAAAACAIFPQVPHPDISAYIQAIPDIAEFEAFANDILSFYKEELLGETTSYVHVRAKLTSKHPKQVLVEMIQEVGDLHTRITAILQDHAEALVAWKAFETGYIAWHFTLRRFRLAELGFKFASTAA
ncbi:terpenoid synthase [Favolaschia claudopus]|uniref:Terpenoid synthase n=1 Tax=Favolaschia claudopus TaxID=2862362 RepID=A0AAW0EK88_9AGAR